MLCRFRSLSVPVLALLLGASACGGRREAPGSGNDPEQPAGGGEKGASVEPLATVPPGSELAANERVLVMVDGANGEKQEQWLDQAAAVRAGYTLVDFSDDWTPFIFAEQRDAAGQQLPNRYRRVVIGLANDQLDGDGEPLEAGEKNYLELYGISPSLSVLRERFLQDEARTCVDPAAQAVLDAVETVPFISPAQLKREAKTEKELETARVKANLATLAELAEKQPKLAAKVQLLERRAKEQLAMAEVERRLACEGLLHLEAPPGAGRDFKVHKPGVYDDAMRAAVLDFQQKNKIYEANYLRKKTMDTIAQPALVNDHDALVRVLRERVMAATGVLEDGSTDTKNGPFQFTAANGSKQPLRNLAEEYVQAMVKQLGLDTPEGALAFFKRHPREAFERFHVGVKLAPRPEYYTSHMDLSIVIDRGDVWYDPPFDDKDKWHAQPRRRYPTLTVFLDYRNERIPLVRWRTTIGGWRSEQASDGYEYYKYKGSDVGPRVIRNVVSGPVWIAPESTPIRSLVKWKKVEGVSQSVVNYDELGPGYLSAYGVVAGYFVIPGEDGRPDADRGIRAHGSSNYLSIYNPEGYSHGCHRLPNHLAVRMYDFLLQHRNMKVTGDSPMSFWRQFLQQDQVYEIRIPSRGYVFELDPPLPVNVLKGEIRGNLKEPIEGYVPKPGVRYPGLPPDQRPDDEDIVTSASVKTTAGTRGSAL